MEYSNSEITRIINEYIHNERNRKLLLRRYVDGITLECLAEEFDLSVRQVKNIIYGNEDVIFKHLENKKSLVIAHMAFSLSKLGEHQIKTICILSP